MLLAVLALVPACGQSAEADRPPELERYSARLAPVNDSGVEGTATLALSGDRLVVEIDATGMEPKRIHAQSLLERTETGRSPCSAARSADADEDDFVTLAEATSAYGPVARPLEPYPTVGSGGELHYRLRSDVDPADVDPLDGRVVLLQGMELGASEGAPADGYDPGVPVACGRLASTARGAGVADDHPP